MTLDEAARTAFAVRALSADQARDLGHGKKIPAAGMVGEYAGFSPQGSLVALLEERDGTACPTAVFQPAGG
jgi:tRNA pseudouridine55 synthase